MKTPGLLAGLTAVVGLLGPGVESRLVTPLPPVVEAISAPAEDSGTSTFEQLIDHSNPSLGTFSQRYWWDRTYWKGPGSPVAIFNPGEVAAESYKGYLTNRTMVGQYAQAIGAATILVEHRFYGHSSPYETLDNKALQYLTLNNSVADMVRFARSVDLPFDTNHSSNAPQVPWVQVGGSYSGALAAWSEKLSPGTYWAYHASSAPVEAVYDYWSYFLPIQTGMPQNCSRNFERIVELVDGVITKGDADEIAELQKSFGLQELAHAEDFAAALAFPLGEWQSLQLFSNYSGFFQMCDTIEGVRAVYDKNANTGTNATIPSTVDTGLEKVLSNYAAWFKAEYIPNFCQRYGYWDWNSIDSVACFDTYNETSMMFTDRAVNNTINRQWYWYICNEPFFYWQTGAPQDRSTIVSRHVTAKYYQRQCELFFPKEGNYTYGSNAGRTAEDVNAVTKGWNLTDTTRVLWVNGELDPWRSASVSSELRPGGPLASRPEAPVFLIPGARHCNELGWSSGNFNKDVRAAQEGLLAQMIRWVDEFPAEGGAGGWRG